MNTIKYITYKSIVCSLIVGLCVGSFSGVIFMGFRLEDLEDQFEQDQIANLEFYTAVSKAVATINTNNNDSRISENRQHILNLYEAHKHYIKATNAVHFYPPAHNTPYEIEIYNSPSNLTMKHIVIHTNR